MKNFGRKGLLIAALVLILAGFFQGDFQDVKNKAIRICYECIGIG
jgi:predicted metal-binding membrane protein